MMKKMKADIETKRLRLSQAMTADKKVLQYHVMNGKALIGKLLLYYDMEQLLAEPDITINEAYQCQGYATEAVDAVINAIVEAYPKMEIIAEVPMDDEAANRLCRRLDFILDSEDADENSRLYVM